MVNGAMELEGEGNVYSSFDKGIMRLTGAITKLLTQGDRTVEAPAFLTPSNIKFDEYPLVSKKFGIFCRQCGAILKNRGTYMSHSRRCTGKHN